MEKLLIIVSGMAAAGKTRFAEWLSNEINVSLLSLDEIWENSGSNDIPFERYWTLCEDIMKLSSPLIIEFGFESRSKPTIEDLVKKYSYQTVNVHFDTSFKIAHRRFNDRRLYDMGGSKPQISLEQYINIANQAKEFSLGNNIIHVDTTNFPAVSYIDILKQIRTTLIMLCV